jgi:hypothetical protein
MRPSRQKYSPVMDRDLDLDAIDGTGGVQSTAPPQILGGNFTETKRMNNPRHPIVNPVTRGDKSLKKRTYEKGRKNQSRS